MRLNFYEHLSSEPDEQPSGHVDAGSPAHREMAVVRVARQSILDREARLVGYELLFRAREAESAGMFDHREATATVILDGLLDVGLSDPVGEGLAYVNVWRDFLLSVRPLPLPARRVVLELLERELLDEAPFEVLDELVAQGFTIALDDFHLPTETEQLLAYARIVKITVLEHTGQILEDLLARLREHRPALTLVAEKVEAREHFELCRGLGFDAFQGYANSAYLALPRRVGSVQEGLAWLGAITVRRFALMAALASASDIPDVLLGTALMRAHMCRMASGADKGTIGDSYSTVGLFSVSDALANAPMAYVIEQLPFRENIAAATTRRWRARRDAQRNHRLPVR